MSINSDLVIIAEVGINHNGSLDDAKRLIYMAKQAGCDAVKFQKRTIETVYSPDILNAPRESPFGTTQRDQKEGLELGKAAYDEIDMYCKLLGIDWFGSAWDINSLNFLQQYSPKFNKVASAMITNIPFLEKCAYYGVHTLIATGMSNYGDIDTAIEIFVRYGTPYSLLHCVSTYPCKDNDCNINMIDTLKDRYPNVSIGYSGHELGITPSLLAVAAGAEIIERHITLDRAGYGSDQSASLERHGLELLVREVRAIKGMLGDGIKRQLPDEIKNSHKLRYW